MNDTARYDAGDTILVEAGSRILSAVCNDDVVARIGGDEFVIFLGEVPCADSASRIADRSLAGLHRSESDDSTGISECDRE